MIDNVGELYVVSFFNCSFKDFHNFVAPAKDKGIPSIFTPLTAHLNWSINEINCIFSLRESLQS